MSIVIKEPLVNFNIVDFLLSLSSNYNINMKDLLLFYNLYIEKKKNEKKEDIGLWLEYKNRYENELQKLSHNKTRYIKDFLKTVIIKNIEEKSVYMNKSPDALSVIAMNVTLR